MGGKSREQIGPAPLGLVQESLSFCRYGKPFSCYFLSQAYIAQAGLG